MPVQAFEGGPQMVLKEGVDKQAFEEYREHENYDVILNRTVT